MASALAGLVTNANPNATDAIEVVNRVRCNIFTSLRFEILLVLMHRLGDGRHGFNMEYGKVNQLRILVVSALGARSCRDAGMAVCERRKRLKSPLCIGEALGTVTP
jgi:hypothetical protein